MTQHQSLSRDRWAKFSVEQQLLMIANEMNRASKLVDEADRSSRRLAYERVLRLAELATQVVPRPALRDELILWRGLIERAYVSDDFDLSAHYAALKALLLLHPAAAKQIPYVIPVSTGTADRTDEDRRD